MNMICRKVLGEFRVTVPSSRYEPAPPPARPGTMRRVAGPPEILTVIVAIDLESLANLLAPRACRTQSGETRLAADRILCKIVAREPKL